jgi:dTDP-4-amino-4,6-dideoxygalactose transaminase
MTTLDPVPVLDLGAAYRELREEIDTALHRVVDRSAFIGGEEVRSFENEFASYLGTEHVIGVANGTDALELCLAALGVGAGDTVLTVPFTFAATVEAIVRAGARPVFSDVYDHDFTIDVDAVTRVLDEQPVRAIIVVHLYGQPADMASLMPLARERGVFVIEDTAQAHGARCRMGEHWPRVGTIGDLAAFSFYPTKNLGAMGDAGAVATHQAEWANRVRLLAAHGDAGKYRHVLADGRNSRLDALQAAVLRVKLRHLDAWNEARRVRAARYDAALQGLPIRLPAQSPHRDHVYHQYTIRFRRRDELMHALAERGVGTSVHYPSALHLQEGFARFAPRPGTLPVAERCGAEVLCLPMYPHLPLEHVDRVAERLRDAVASLPPRASDPESQP